jgi:CHAD domain-containing protein
MAEHRSDRKPGSGDRAISYCSYGFQYIRKSWLALVREAGGARKGTDPEHVHRMRVASRRLRAAMPIFKSCFPGKKYRKWLKEIKNITASLGEARDLDVQIGFLEDYLHERLLSLPERAAGGTVREPGAVDASALLRLLQQKREQVQTAVEVAGMSLEKGGVFDEFGDVLASPGPGGKGIRKPGALHRKSQLKISSRMDDLLAYEPAVHDPDAVTRHHEMRIAAKRLRYTLEAFNSLYSGELKEPVRKVRALQDVLGQMHDCDVWIGYLPGFMQEPQGTESEPPAGRHIPGEGWPGIPGLLEDRKQERIRLYRAFVELWDGLRDARFFETLRELIRQPPPETSGDETQVTAAGRKSE